MTLYVQEMSHGKKVKDGVLRRLAKRLYPATMLELLMVSEADQFGRGLGVSEKD